MIKKSTMNSRKEMMDNLNISNISFSSSKNLNLDSECYSKLLTSEDSLSKKANVLFRTFHESTEQNISLNKEMLSLFSNLGLEQHKLSNPVSESLQKLKIVNVENVLDLDSTTLRLNLISKNIADKKKKREERLLKNAYDKSFKKFNTLYEKSQKLFDAVANLESDFRDEVESIEKDAANLILLENKITEYNKIIEQTQSEIQDMNIKEINPKDIVTKANLVTEKKGELLQVEDELKYYGDLPPNLFQAKVALDAKSEEYTKIKELLEKKI